jgi:chaperonin GroES
LASAGPKFRPLADRILVRKVVAETKTASGLFLPEAAQDKVQNAKVLAVGPGKYLKDGTLSAISVKVGDTVVIPEYGGMKLKLDGEELQVFRNDDLVGLMKEE